LNFAEIDYVTSTILKTAGAKKKKNVIFLGFFLFFFSFEDFMGQSET